MDYQSYDVQSFDEEAPGEEERQLQVQAPKGVFDPAVPPAEQEGRPGFEQEEPDVEMSSGQTDFASIKFQRENTLLTNAERYADSIREEAELYVRQLQSEIEALNEQADKRYEEARQVKEEGEAEARRLIEDADRHVDEIRRQGHSEGFEQGRAEGLQKRYEEAGGHLANIEEILNDLSRYREQVNYYAEKDSVRLAVLMAKTILAQELKINKQVVWRVLAATLAKMEGKGVFRVWLNPEDFQFATAARPALEKFINEDQSLVFRPRPDLPPGNAMIETDREMIDLTFANQFRHIENVLYQALAEREAAVMNLPPEMAAASQETSGLPDDPGATGQEGGPEDDDAQQGTVTIETSPDALAEATATIAAENTEEAAAGQSPEPPAPPESAGSDE